jgi:hypothetical protein
MIEEHYQRLNSELGLEFDLFAIENDEWMERNVPNGSIVVLQTDDPGFNDWARRIAEKNRQLEKPPRPIVLVHIRELRPRQSRIIRADAEMLTPVSQ